MKQINNGCGLGRELRWLRIPGLLLWLAPTACEEQEAVPETAPPVQEERALQPGEPEPAAPRQPVAGEGPADITTAARSLGEYVGRPVEGTAEVTEVISDRGFWMTVGDRRVLGVVREDVPEREMIDIDRGQRLKFSGQVLSSATIDQVQGELEADTKRAIQGQPGFVAMHWRDVRIVEE